MTRPLTQFAMLALCGTLTLGGCAELTKRHGYIPRQEELALITPGQDDRIRVEEVIGAPSAASLRDDNTYYYVRSSFTQIGPAAPKITTRDIITISFDENDIVESIGRFSLEDGKIVPLALEITKGADIRPNYLAQLLSRIGRFSAEDVIK